MTELAPSHKATVCPVPTPDNTEVLSIFCQAPVPVPAQFGISSFHITQSPTAQELGSQGTAGDPVVPLGCAVPISLHI